MRDPGPKTKVQFPRRKKGKMVFFKKKFLQFIELCVECRGPNKKKETPQAKKGDRNLEKKGEII